MTDEFPEFHFIILIIVISVLVYYFVFHKKTIEPFTSIGEITLKKNEEIYDDFYVSVYDELLHDETRCEWEIGYLLSTTQQENDSYILDVGSGTGNTVSTFNLVNLKTIGIDKSQAMIDHSRKTFQEYTFVHGDILDSMVFEPESFTTITCLYFTIYYMIDKRLFFDNCIRFLKPGGYLMIHLVNREKFDTLLPNSNPLLLISPQSYTDKRITRSVGKFENHDYTADFTFKGSNVTFYETFSNKKTNAIRKHELKLYMETQKDILKHARNAGFILKSQTAMDNCEHKHQYLYILQKPR